ncbi:UNVERIFIED_CONTAM: hypothetical protein RMT77_011720 [Armadillidium vulgare]
MFALIRIGLLTIGAISILTPCILPAFGVINTSSVVVWKAYVKNAVETVNFIGDVIWYWIFIVLTKIASWTVLIGTPIIAIYFLREDRVLFGLCAI